MCGKSKSSAPPPATPVQPPPPAGNASDTSNQQRMAATQAPQPQTFGSELGTSPPAEGGFVPGQLRPQGAM